MPPNTPRAHRSIDAAASLVGRRLAALSLAALSALSVSGAVQAQNAPEPLSPLSRAKRPEPSNLSEFVADKSAAIALGKALFWDSRLGSDGKTACATCHFHAGADPRSINQVSPRANGSAADAAFLMTGANYQWKLSDFPLHQLADPGNRDSAVLRSLNVVSGSHGAYRESFSNVVPGQADDARQVVYDPVFHVGALNTRQATARNAPSVINAVFNLRNFWDGRAQTIFNGVNVWGKRDTGAKVYRSPLPWNPLNLASTPYATTVTINDSSLASQASGPPLNGLEMSAAGRAFPELGRKMYALRPLAGQPVAADDSVLASRRHPSGDGLATASYADLVRAAFKPDWWNGNRPVSVGGKSYSHMEANFSLVFGLALQLYQATLVSDQTPLDRYLEGNTASLTDQQKLGLSLFTGKGKCLNCHGGAALTNASIHRQLITGRMTEMVVGDGGRAVYDEGFYNIGITRSTDDPGVGGNDPFGNPLSFSGLAKKSNLLFNLYELDLASAFVTPFSRIAVDGAFKVPGLRNVALTAPYFHNGGMATLAQVVDFYNRGGNFAAANIANLDADIQPLGLTATEKQALVAFLQGLTDERVRVHAAPFDHPQLVVNNGHAGSTSVVYNDGYGRAAGQSLLVPAVGRNGYSAAQVPQSFLGLKQ